MCWRIEADISYFIANVFKLLKTTFLNIGSFSVIVPMINFVESFFTENGFIRFSTS